MNEDPYYLGNFECPPTKFTVQTGHRTIIQELPWDAGADDLCDAFYTALVGMTFHPDGIIQAMKEFVEERTPEEEIDDGEE